MKLSVYLPDEVGKAAKARELNLSGLLRRAVIAELEKPGGLVRFGEGPRICIYPKRG